MVDQLETLLREGVEQCRVSTVPPAELAASSCRPEVLTAMSQECAVVYCTDSPADRTPTEDLWDFLQHAGIPDHPAVVCGGSGCGNLGPGLAVARGLLSAGDSRDVLLVTTDRVVRGTRLVPDGLTVLSDSAASCRVTLDPPEIGFRITGLATLVQADTQRQGHGLAAARSLIAAVSDLVPRAFSGASRPSDECRYLLTGNYGTTPRSLLAMASGLDPSVHYAPRVSELGHCFSADMLIGLQDLIGSGGLRQGDQVMLIASSPKAWTVLGLNFYRKRRLSQR